MNGHPSEALQRYWDIRHRFNPEPVIELALKDGLASCKSRSYLAVSSVLQLLSCHAESPHMEVPFVLASGEVYSMYAALRKHYGNQFDEWCYDHFKVCHHHLLLSDVSPRQPDVEAGVIYTLGQLEGNYCDELEAMLYEWIGKRDDGRLRPCALIWKKNRHNEQFSATPLGVQRLIDRWIQYVE